MSMDDSTPRSDPYYTLPEAYQDQGTQRIPLYGPAPIPPPPPAFSREPTLQSHFEQLTPTTPARPPQVTPTVRVSPPPAPTMPKPPKRKGEISARRAIFYYASIIAGAFILCVIAANVMYNQSHQWTVLQTYDNYRAQHVTEALTVPNNWRIVWQCTNTGAPESITINFYDANGGLQQLVSDTCQGGTRRGVTNTIAQGGTITIDINSGAIWTVDVQEQT